MKVKDQISELTELLHDPPNEGDAFYFREQLNALRKGCEVCGSDRAETIGFVNRSGRVCVNVRQCERRARDRAIATALIELHETT